MPMSPFAVAVLAGLSAPAVVFAQADARVTFAPELRVGDTMRYVLSLDSTVEQEGSEQPKFTQRVAQTVTLDLEVVRVDERVVVLGGEVSGLNLQAMWGGRMYAYEWPKVTLEEPLRLPPVLILEQIGQRARDVRVRVRVDLPTASGEPGAVVATGFEDVATALENQDVFDAMALGMLANEQVSDALEGAFFVEGASGKAFRPGTGWQTEERINLGPAGAIDVTTSWKFESLDGATATVRGTPRASVARPAHADPASPSVGIVEQDATVHVVWDVEASRAAERTSTQRMTTLWALGPLSLTQKQDTTLSVKRER